MPNDGVNTISAQLLPKTKKEKGEGLVEAEQDESIIGLLSEYFG